jgi:hypothetical protein
MPSDDGAFLRSIVSVALFVHLFCVAVVLSSNYRRSLLQNRLVSIFACYTELLHFDPDFTPYYYTFGRPRDDDTWIVIDLYADAEQPVTAQALAKSVRLPEGGTNWLGDRRRCFRLAHMLAFYGDPENENDEVAGAIASEIARSVAARMMRQSNNRRAVVRCIRRMSQPLDLATLDPGFPPDRPTDPAYDVTVYEADVWIDEDNQMQALRRASRAEVAPRQTTPQPAGTRNRP